ncbi:DUF4238 domain-containing protein [Sphingomonas aracearum]|uniref:DUF4238 domain-containing protein n=1 Tax=Sphingomonas aracearum TaxID=2283317 RepID=A0A369VUN4_9SPHN|nr:DUF4238 domain-containing protein [Sphingomonas aracearum]RDE05569.1 DUF4238 domain-containing protein [Sphingomonas aracearum]
MKKRPLKTELHHWWPRTLAEHWADHEGMVSVIRPNGEVRRAPPGAFGAITNAHHMKMGGPWDSTFEPIFNQPDAEMSDLVRWLSTLEAPIVAADQPMVKRIAAQSLPPARQHQLARVTASLLARTPRVRHVIKLTTEQFRSDFGLADTRADKTLIALNQRGLYDAYRKYMEESGRWAVLFSDEREFIAGDGFFHNLPSSKDGLNSGRKLVLPILPTASIVFLRPMSHPSDPRLVTLRLNSDEVEKFNDIVQVYASDFLFFREQKPILIDDFKIEGHREFKYHGHDWLDSMLDDLSQYCLWGRGGSPVIGSERPFSESLQGNRWLEQFMAEPR